MAQAGVSYTWGAKGHGGVPRVARGVESKRRSISFARACLRSIRPAVTAEIAPRFERPIGGADNGAGYNFRLCMTKVIDNRVPWPKPHGYDAARYELLARYLPAFEAGSDGRWRQRRDEADIVQNGKNRHDNNGAFSTDYIGRQLPVSERRLATRARNPAGACRLRPGFSVLLANDRPGACGAGRREEDVGTLPRRVRDADHWPYTLRPRSQRMIGEYVMSQQDINRAHQARSDRDGLVQQDSHNVQRRRTRRARRWRTRGTCRCASRRTRFPIA